MIYPVAILIDAWDNGFGDRDDLQTTRVIGRDGLVRAELTPDQILVTEKSLDDVVLPLFGKSAA